MTKTGTTRPSRRFFPLEWATIAVLAFSIASCNSVKKDERPAAPLNEQVPVEDVAKAPQGEQLEKSGVVRYRYYGAYEGTQTFHFDDYGKLYRIEDEYNNLASVGAPKVHQLFVQNGEKAWFVNMIAKKGYVVEGIDQATRNNMLADFVQLGIDSTMAKNGFERVGEREVAKKQCIVYRDPGGTEFCFDGNVNIQTNMVLGNTQYTLQAEEVNYRKNVGAEMFEIPKDVKILTREEYQKQQIEGRL